MSGYYDAVTGPPRGYKRKQLTLKERMDVVKRYEAGATARQITLDIGVGKTQVHNIIREKETIKQRWESGENSDTKCSKMRKCSYGSINVRLWDWFCEIQTSNVPVTGKMLQDKGKEFAQEEGLESFSASNGWLESWQRRYNVRFSAMCTDVTDIIGDTIQELTKQLLSLCEGYKPENIFNATETGLFFKAYPADTMDAYKTTDTSESTNLRLNKHKITVLLAASGTGEKLKLLVIGKHKNPVSLNCINMTELDVAYHCNKEAMMTTDIFCDWAKKLNNEMCSQGRKILLLVDKCGAHPPLQLSNIKFLMLPPAISKLQPLKAGVIQAVKLDYRTTFLRHIHFLLQSSIPATGPELAASVSLLETILWLRESWDNLRTDIIKKCFAKFGIGSDTEAPNRRDDKHEIDPYLKSHFPKGVNMKVFAAIDDKLQTTTITHDADVSTVGDNDVNEDEDEQETKIIDSHTASAYVEELIKYALAHEQTNFVQTLNEFKSSIQKNYLNNCLPTERLS